jgi:hypothetical protein
MPGKSVMVGAFNFTQMVLSKDCTDVTAKNRFNFREVSGAVRPEPLQVFASPLHPSPAFPEDLAIRYIDSRCSIVYLGVSPRPPAPLNKTKRMFRYARSGCRTLPPRILHLLRCTLPNLIERRSTAYSKYFHGD